MEFLKAVRTGWFNDDYIEFLVENVWKIRKPVNVIDFGCGFGYVGLLLLPMLPKGSTYTGINNERIKTMLKLVTPDKKYENQFKEMMGEWYQVGEEIVPYSICRLDYRDFDAYLNGFEEEKKGCLYGGVPATTLWAYDDERNRMIGAVNIRHWLNEKLLKNGGHIGDGVRPSERRKGYATKMIALALKECKKMGIDRVLMVCLKENIGSRKSIINNRGILENEIVSGDGEVDQRYWIQV